jgi:hypothetical protein
VELRINFQLGRNLHEIALIVAVIDTHLISRRLLMAPFRLMDILKALGCPYEPHCFHNAGNDAAFTLEAMLMLAIKSCESRILSEAEASTVEMLKLVSQADWHKHCFVRKQETAEADTPTADDSAGCLNGTKSSFQSLAQTISLGDELAEIMSHRL